MAVKKITHASGRGHSYEMTCKIQGRVVRRRFPTKRAASDEYARLRSAASDGSLVNPAAGRVPLRDYGLQWLGSRQVRPGTLANYEVNWRRHVEPALGDLQVRQVTRQEVARLITGLTASGMAPTTVRKIYKIVAMVFAEAVEDRLIPQSPCRRIPLPAVPSRRLPVFTPEQVQALLTAARPLHHAALFTAFGTGLRQAELLGLTVDNVDLASGRVHVVQQLITPPSGGQPALTRELKTPTSRRSVPLPPVVTAALAQHLDEHGVGQGGLLFRNPRDLAWRRGAFNDSVWKPTLRRAGLDVRHGLHAARHTYASGLIQEGIDVRTVASYLGHKSPVETLNTYAHLFPDTEERAAAALQQRYLPGG